MAPRHGPVRRKIDQRQSHRDASHHGHRRGRHSDPESPASAVRNWSRIRNGRRYGRWVGGRFQWPILDRRRLRVEIRGDEQFVPFLRGEPQRLGAPEDVIAIAGPCGEALLPADQSRAAHTGPAGQVGIANPRPGYVGGEKFAEIWQKIQPCSIKSTECYTSVVQCTGSAHLTLTSPNPNQRRR